ncbi:hypothetical protein Gogos_008712 [Gossypium gossypioides]|uniref:Uncharacterized protein n=1 Tax=Gossypium gossypioides TaxID=34282 RepID=A0A7J9CCI4_GOSGO|nr:hypothetical protein [Gossypium gossypioides]
MKRYKTPLMQYHQTIKKWFSYWLIWESIMKRLLCLLTSLLLH